jgi:2'-5' RNA ligase
VARSALIVEVPEAESAVHDWRARYDNARLGVPAHITLLFPFVPADRLDDRLRGDLRGLFSTQPSISYSLTKVTVFPDQTIWLAPEPSEPFKRMTESIVERFPDYSPYEGIHDQIIPHLTVTSGDAALQHDVEADLAPQLPIHAKTRHVTLLLEDESGRWRVDEQIPLSG